MKYNKKSNISTRVFLVILVTVIVAGAGYLLGKNSSQSFRVKPLNDSILTEMPEIAPEVKVKTKISNSDVVSEWNALSSTDLYALAKLGNIYITPDSRIVLKQAVDLTGDGIAEGIFEGNGGNSGVSFILIKGEDGKNMIAKQKNKEGLVDAVQLLSVGRAMVQATYDILPFDNGFYTASLSYDETAGGFTCNADGVNAYSWNSLLGLFDWNEELTAEFTDEICN